MISSRYEELIQCWGTAKKTFSSEDIHDLRVASRRLREAISIFEPCYPAKKMSHIKTQAKHLTTILGSLRNIDEALQFFEPLILSLAEPSAASLDTWLQSLRMQRIKEHRHIEDRIKKMDPVMMQYGLRKALEQPHMFGAASYDPFMPISQYLSSKLLERETSLLQLLPGSLHEQDIHALHQLRIALKKFRYAFELTAPLNRNGYKNLYDIIKEFQEVLGKIHDLDVFLGLLQEQERFDPKCAGQLEELIASRRKKLYADFLTMHTANPIDHLGERTRNLL
nr:CHAD domain-containing protein [Geoanaerobacter pelophilus]